MRAVLVALASGLALSAGPVVAVTYTYEYLGNVLVCDVDEGDGCKEGDSLPPRTERFSVDADSADFDGGDATFEWLYEGANFGEDKVTERITRKRAGTVTTTTIYCDQDEAACRSYSFPGPEWLSDVGTLWFYFSTGNDDDVNNVVLDFTGGRLTGWNLESSTNGCGSGGAWIVRNIGICRPGWDDYFDLRAEAGDFLYGSTAPGTWTRTVTPAPIPLPAASVLMLAGLAGLGAVAGRRRRTV